MNKQEQLRKNEVDYARAKTVEEAAHLDREWNAIWASMTTDERRIALEWLGAR